MNRKLVNKKHEKGQGLVEYALILVLVAIVVIAALTLLGPTISSTFSSVNTSLTGAGGGGTPVDCGFYGSATLSCVDGWHAACNPGPVCIP
jgi:pilus assembly protein Flp/PilA